MTHKFDCAMLNTKKALLQKFADMYEEMYSLNYDAWVDAATFCKEDVTWEFTNIEKYEDPTLLRAVLQDIASQNPHVTVVEK